ncbi:MAG: SRPBCC family protein [Candidatus Cohnella colombiensis]|uniref:SRPBCC family protein n=1 Tax=Candidatus Cohnella colombiensis TaxID=3121368 RepID=A0AA95F015_9BACL|nr:MAG: SRPBCC family protein [Cohnella sp.]
MITVQTEIEISAPIQLCFDMARDIDMHTKTVWKHTRERAILGVTSGPIGAGDTVTFQATHFLVRQKLTSKITEFDEPFRFVDEMQRGAFKSLRHIHDFKQIGDQTIMTDTLYFEAPMGFIGKVVERLILKHYMKRFLEHRNRELKTHILNLVK